MIARFEGLVRALIPALVVAVGAFAADVAGQQKIVLKASDVHPLGYPTVVAVENIGNKLTQATNGGLSVQMYASMLPAVALDLPGRGPR
jgi:TRAP-type C4-dicarboxylate transport system substrate-binding protein